MPSYLVKNAYGEVFGSIELESEPRVGNEIDCSINGIYTVVECRILKTPIIFGGVEFTKSIRARFKKEWKPE